MSSYNCYMAYCLSWQLLLFLWHRILSIRIWCIIEILLAWRNWQLPTTQQKRKYSLFRRKLNRMWTSDGRENDKKKHTEVISFAFSNGALRNTHHRQSDHTHTYDHNSNVETNWSENYIDHPITSTANDAKESIQMTNTHQYPLLNDWHQLLRVFLFFFCWRVIIFVLGFCFFAFVCEA